MDCANVSHDEFDGTSELHGSPTCHQQPAGILPPLAYRPSVPSSISGVCGLRGEPATSGDAQQRADASGRAGK